MMTFGNPSSVSSITTRGRLRQLGSRGFSLIEVMLVVLILTTLTGIAMSLVLQAEKTVQDQLSSSTLGTNAIMALNQMSREIRMAGFPSAGSFTAPAVLNFPGLVATPFVAISSYDLKLEEDVNGDGRVEQIEYVLPAGSRTLIRVSTAKSLDGTLLADASVSVPFLSNVQNQIQANPLFIWETDPLNPSPFPQNIRAVYVNLILASSSNGSGRPINITLTAACQRMNP